MSQCEEFQDDSVKDAAVRGYLHRASLKDADCLILTHGACANCKAPLLVALAEAFCAACITVLRFDLPFRQSRPHGPPLRSAEKDQAGLRAAVAAIHRESHGKVFLGGHSYGGRQASMLAAAEPGLMPALLLLSYPLHPPGNPDQMRTQHFPSLQTPSLFVSGERDEFGTQTEFASALQLIPAKTELMAISGAGHALLTPRNRAELPHQIVSAFLQFTGALVPRG